jgi:hypothetical protein
VLRVALVAALLISAGCGDSGSSEAKGGGGSSAGGTSNGGAGGTGNVSGAGGTGASSSGGSAPTDPNECATPGADWVFCSDFEEGNKDVWDDYDGNPDETNTLLEDPGPFGLGANHVMRFRAPPGNGGVDLVKVLPDEYDALHTRWYIRFEPGFDLNAPNHGSGLHAGHRDWLGHSDTQPNGTDWFSAWIEHLPESNIPNYYVYYPGMYQDCVDPNGACWGDHFPCTFDEGTGYCEKAQHRETTMPAAYVTGQWYCVELMVDGGTATASEAGANGSIGFWIDGAEQGPWNDLWLRSDPNLKLGILWLNLFHHEEHSVEGLMFDNVVVSTSRVGCL